MKPSEALRQHRDDILAIASKYRVKNLRVFGSVLRGDDKEGSDLDILVDALPGLTLFGLGGLQEELKASLGVRIDVLTALDLPESFRNKVVEEAQAI